MKKKFLHIAMFTGMLAMSLDAKACGTDHPLLRGIYLQKNCDSACSKTAVEEKKRGYKCESRGMDKGFEACCLTRE